MNMWALELEFIELSDAGFRDFRHEQGGKGAATEVCAD